MNGDGVNNEKRDMPGRVEFTDADSGYKERAANELNRRIAEFEEFLASDKAHRKPRESGKRAPRAEYPKEVRKAVGGGRGKRSVKLGRKPTRVENIHAGHRERMRQTVRRNPTLGTLSDVEVLEFVLAHAVPYKDTNPLAHELLARFGSLHDVFNATEAELAEVHSMTRAAARLLKLLSETIARVDVSESNGVTHSDVLSLVLSLYLGGSGDEVFAVFFDSDFGIAAIEKLSESEGVSIGDVSVRRSVVGSTCKYGAKYVLIACRDKNLFPEIKNLSGEVAALKLLLEAVEARLTDYIVICECGYYTLGSTAANECAPEFVFIPLSLFSRAPELAFDIEEDAEQHT